jgi:hypothetical protein
MDVAGLLRSLDLGKHEATFRDSAIDDSVLPYLTGSSALRAIASVEVTAHTCIDHNGKAS